MPTFNTLIAQHGDERSMGEIMGINSGIISLSNALCPVIAATVYGLIGHQLYYFLTILPILALFIARQIWPSASKHQRPLFEHLRKARRTIG